MSDARQELAKMFKQNRRLAELNPKIAAQVLSGKTPESLTPARLPRQDAWQDGFTVQWDSRVRRLKCGESCRATALDLHSTWESRAQTTADSF